MAGLAAAFGRGAMTNHWTDIANATLVLVWGANPTENHPACMAHINRARNPKQYFAASDPRSLKTPAKLIVVDPRKTRTAAQADLYVRIRPGSDIAFGNGLLNYMITKVEALPGGNSVRTKFFTYLNQTGNGTFFTDGTQGAATVTDEAMALTNATAGTVAKARIAAGTLVVRSAAAGGGTLFTEGANKDASADYFVSYPAGTVTRCTASTIPSGSTVYLTYSTSGSYSMAVPGSSKYTDARFVIDPATGTDYLRAVRAAGTPDQMSDFPVKVADVTDTLDPNYSNTVYNRMKMHVAAYDLATVADICGCATTEIAAVGDAIIENSRCSTGASTDPRDPGYRATTMLYAMGITQHTCGGANVKTFAQVATIMGNMGRAGGGINALRGIHNVQGSTDMGLLYGNIPGYSANPTEQFPTVANAFGRYLDGLWGTPITGTGNRNVMNGSYDDAYLTGAQALQQRGFYNMTLKWFGDYDYVNGLTGTSTGGALRGAVDKLYSLWPKGQGANHIQMFRDMDSGLTKAAFVLGQNPAVTEANQSKVRDGLRKLDLLVVTDMFENETAACDRKDTGITYLIPACAHPEKAGSSTNSGRTLQWRYQARPAAGNSKDDIEVLLRFAKALDTEGAFAHISAVWATIPGHTTGNVYDLLYKKPYTAGAVAGSGFDGLTGYALISGVADMAKVRDNTSDVATYSTPTVTGSEWAAEKIYREFTSGVTAGGCVWIYTGAYSTDRTTNRHQGQATWPTDNRAKSRDRSDPNNTLAFPGWGFAWLVNRRVLYNNNPATFFTSLTSTHDVPGDVNDLFMGPDSCARLFVSTNENVLNYSRWYRKVHLLKDKPDTVVAGSINALSPHYVAPGLTYAGRFPAHVEPYETPRRDLAALWGRNTKGGAKWDLVLAGTPVAYSGLAGDPTLADPLLKYPLVLTTIRCVEHFQGGPITRNNPWNVEAEPEPWIEINSIDARANNIVDGELVKIVTARTENATAGGEHLLANPGAGWRARVGVGQATNQRVGAGVVGIPWHWGEKGLSTGSRANDLTIDAMDANTTIPEYKACLCRIEKM